MSDSQKNNSNATRPINAKQSVNSKRLEIHKQLIEEQETQKPAKKNYISIIAGVLAICAIVALFFIFTTKNNVAHKNNVKKVNTIETQPNSIANVPDATSLPATRGGVLVTDDSDSTTRPERTQEEIKSLHEELLDTLIKEYGNNYKISYNSENKIYKLLPTGADYIASLPVQIESRGNSTLPNRSSWNNVVNSMVHFSKYCNKNIDAGVTLNIMHPEKDEVVILSVVDGVVIVNEGK